jgi:hypothetical protein
MRQRKRQPSKGIVGEALDTFWSRAAGYGFSWHPLDMDRFYEFVLLAHQHRKRLSADDLEEVLKQKGVESENAAKLARYYEFGRKLLHFRKSGYRLFSRYRQDLIKEDLENQA